ncbi:MAG: UDP-3-O-acyl-N-acetylglucosamine deacetylase [Armatimonadetes bacterium]|nr:UDP-3-O-acyl-N-acetylglucosamine deacetylase [Armatimonadota bacterium]
MTKGESSLRPQCTVGKEGSLSGTGLHTGLAVSLTIKPAPPGTGIVFQRTDADGLPLIRADVSSIMETRRSTTLGRNGVQVKTVEHLLAAIWALGLDNVSIHLDGPEVPAFDGSALTFVETLLELGVKHQDIGVMTHTLSSPLCLALDDAYILALPTDGGLSFTYVAEFPHPLIGMQRFDLMLDPECFAREIAPARTFGFLEEVQELYANDLARGASLQNRMQIRWDANRGSQNQPQSQCRVRKKSCGTIKTG